MLSLGFRDGSIAVHDVRIRDSLISFRQGSSAGHEQEVCGMRWNNDGTVLATGGNDNKVMLWDLATQRNTHTFVEHKAAVKAIAWCPWDRSLLATGGGTADR